MASKNCPKCGLISAASAIRCDCGYDFASGKVKDSYLNQKSHHNLIIAPPGEKLAASNRRMVNYIIDRVLLIALFAAIIILFRDTISGSGQGFAFFFLFLYYFVFELIFQKTPAKFITRTKVVMDDGSKPPVGAVFIRTLCRFVPLEILSGRKEIWWHDRWSETRVIMDEGRTI